MQVLKDDIRNNILKAALLEFRQEGYMHASMRRIAQAAGITIGNIYRYFKNKEELFDAIVQPVSLQYTECMENIREEIVVRYTKDTPSPQPFFNKVQGTIVMLFKTHSSELTILLNLSNGSKYEQVKPKLIDLTLSILERVLLIERGEDTPLHTRDLALASMLASTIVEGLCLILRDNDQGDTLEQLIDQFLFLYSTGIKALITE
jgi:AcrR family transcriptional regulator